MQVVSEGQLFAFLHWQSKFLIWLLLLQTDSQARTRNETILFTASPFFFNCFSWTSSFSLCFCKYFFFFLQFQCFSALSLYFSFIFSFYTRERFKILSFPSASLLLNHYRVWLRVHIVKERIVCILPFGFFLNRISKRAKSLSDGLLVVGTFFDESLIKSDGSHFLPPDNWSTHCLSKIITKPWNISSSACYVMISKSSLTSANNLAKTLS